MKNNTNSQAVIKLRKFRETLSDTSDGNPEPSPDNREGAETRHGVCLTCGDPIIGRQKTAKYCSKTCKKISRRNPMKNKTCRQCNNPIPKTKNANAAYCSDVCRNRYNAYKHAVKTGRIKNPGVGRGGDQDGVKNPNWKNGIGIYNKKAFNHLPHICNRCGEGEDLLVHHKDHDRGNNELSNLEILCKGCHQHHHTVRDEHTGRYIPQT